MPRYDLYHEPVKRALIKDGWSITADPFTLEYKELRVLADLAAEKALAAEKQGRKIAIEIKVFGSASPISELEKAIGQYGLYRSLLKRLEPERELFLAVAQDVYVDFLQQAAVQEVLADHQMRLLIFEPVLEEIIAWIN
ncbi:MAG: element excision factor XisH family protein [Caldilineaceae bacterium]